MLKILEKLRTRDDKRTTTAESGFRDLVVLLADGKIGSAAADLSHVESVLIAAGKTAADLEREVERLGEARTLAEVANECESRRQELFDARARLTELHANHMATLDAYRLRCAAMNAEVGRLQAVTMEASGARKRLLDEFRDTTAAVGVAAEDGLRVACVTLEDAVRRRDRVQSKIDELKHAGDVDGVAAAQSELDSAEAAVVTAQDALSDAESTFAKG